MYEVSSADATMASTYIPDTLPPYVISWFADMSAEVLTITFSKPIDRSTVQISDIKLSVDTALQITSTEVYLESSYVLSNVLNVLSIKLHSSDVVRMHQASADLCSSVYYCQLSFESSFVKETVVVSSKTGVAQALPVEAVQYMQVTFLSVVLEASFS